jgi:hypothetical protein
MREVLSDSLSPATNLSETDKAAQMKRRQFLQTIGLGFAGLALSSNGVLSKPAFAGPTLAKFTFAEPVEPIEWRDRVTGFVYTICDGDYRQAESIIAQIRRTTILDAPAPIDFHTRYAARFIFQGASVSSKEVICGNGFAVNQFPLYDLQCPCGRTSDLNNSEILAVTNPREIARFGCVMAPRSERKQFENNDHADYSRTASSEWYRSSPDDFRVEYKRVLARRVRSRTTHHYAYHVVDKRYVGPNRQPLRGILISSEEI